MELRIFGPVPSRRLGKSLGVNNIPHKICSYSCVYFQVGKAVKMQVLPADESTVIEAFHIFSAHIGQVELLTGYEGNAFSSTGNFREDILSITAVHPMREDAVMGLLKKNNTDISALTSLIEEGMMEKSKFGDYFYYLRKFHN